MPPNTYPTPDNSYRTILSQALYQGYLEPVQRLLHRKVNYWNTLAEQDRFNLSDIENQRLQRRLDTLTEEMQAIENLLHAVTDMASLYWDHLDQLQNENKQYRHLYRSSSKSLSMLISVLELEITHP